MWRKEIFRIVKCHEDVKYSIGNIANNIVIILHGAG